MKQTIKIYLCAITLIFFQLLQAVDAFAQAPQLFNYQGVARDAKGNPIANQRMTIKLSVLPAADATQPEYEETQVVNTNNFGLYTLQIGNGTTLTGQMKTVKWETGNKYIKVAIDPAGGTNFTDAGTNQLLSVPYAIYADKAGSSEHDKTRTGAVNSNAAHVAGDANYLSKFTALNTIGKSLLFDNGTSIGLGTATPSAAAKMHLYNAAGNAEFIRMQNINSTGFSKFIMYNDISSNYATFTKYGSAYPGGYPGIASLFPYANMLAFGNNLGPFMLANNGNVGIGIVSGGSTVLKFNAQQASGYIGIGGNAMPASNVHFNNSSNGDTIIITNATTGHTGGDGLQISNTGNAATVMNKENSSLAFGTNNAPRLTLTPAGNTELTGQIKIAGGTPGAGKVLTSDANGLATWETPAGGGGNISGTGTANYISKFTGAGTIANSTIFDNGTNVGLGMGTPHAPLQFANTPANRKQVLYEVTNNDHQFFGFGINPGLLRYQIADVVNNHVFYAGVNSTTSNELMRIQGNGNVGIGTATPHAPLQFSNAQANRKIVLAENADNDHSYYGFGINAGMIRYQVGALGGNHVFYAAVNGFSSNELMRIQGNGNVGIGTGTPNAALQLGNVSSNRRIVMYENANNDHEFYGLGINPAAVRYQVGTPLSSHIFYAAVNSTTSTELMRILGSGRVGIGTAAPGGQFELSLDQGRKPSTSTWTITSDERLKTINGTYTKGLNEILQLNPITYKYKNTEGRTFSEQVLKTQNVGFSAQDVQKVFPEAVATDEDGYLNLNIHPILVTYVNAIKELNEKNEAQQKLIEAQQKINETLIKRLEALESK